MESLPEKDQRAVIRLIHSLVASSGNGQSRKQRASVRLAAALDRARASLARGERIPHEDILREFGLGK